jgi:flagellar biosynthesis protein FlhG
METIEVPKDQSATLRRIATGSKGPQVGLFNGLKSIAVTSGKGGVGKTSLVANLAFVFSEKGLRVLVLDGDVGLANIDVLLGLSPKQTIKDFLDGNCSLKEILIEGPKGMHILPAGSGVLELTNLSSEQRMSLISEINALRDEHDLLLIDTAAGVSSNVLNFNAIAEEVLIAVTPEPTSITDAYALIKLMSMKFRRKRFLVVVNEARSLREAHQVFQGLNMVVERFLHFSLTELGYLPYDSAVGMAVKSQQAFVERFPEARVSKCLRDVADKLCKLSTRDEALGEVNLFGPYA